MAFIEKQSRVNTLPENVLSGDTNGIYYAFIIYGLMSVLKNQVDK